MNKTATLILALTLLGGVLPGQAEPQAPIPTTKDLDPRPFARRHNGVAPLPAVKTRVEAFLTQLTKNEINKGFETLLEGTRLSAREENVKVLIDKTQQATSLYGKITDYEVIDTYQIGTRLLITTYLTALQVQPLRWRFVYYKANESWQLIDLRVDDSLVDLVEQ